MNTPARSAAASTGVLVLTIIGLIVSQQSTSLLNSSGVIWTGVVVAGAGVAAAFFLPTHTWVRVVAALALGAALVNAVYIEHQMSERRDEIREILFDARTRRRGHIMSAE